MSDTTDPVEKLLEEIRDNQRIQLQHQEASLNLQKEQYAIKQQFDKANKLQDRAEMIQEKGAQLVEKARKVMVVIVPIIIVLIIVLAFMMFWR
jgi:uncharacterized membrane protein (DUF106 family)